MSASPASGGRSTTYPPIAFVVFAWVLVGVPLLYGLIRTIQAASALFTG